MKKLSFIISVFTALLLASAAQSSAQKIISGKLDPNAGKVNANVKSAIEKKAAADKILAATLNNVRFKVSHSSAPETIVFTTCSINLKGSNGGSFSLDGLLKEAWQYNTSHENSYYFSGLTYKTDKVGNEVIRSCTYREIMENGFTADIYFKGRRSPRFPVGTPWSGDFFVSFEFSGGITVQVPLQDINMAVAGTWKTTSDLTVSKTIAGNAFPDPANPVVLPVIK